LRELNDYVAEYCNNVFPLEEGLRDLENKRVEAAKTSDSKKANFYKEVEADKCEEIKIIKNNRIILMAKAGKLLGIDVLNHIIVAYESHYSFNQNNQL
jgi:hypothetical protein